jgi:hypothetical protein
VLFALIFLFRIYSANKKKKDLLLVVYGIFLVIISIYSYFLRIYLFGHIGAYLPFLFPLVFCAGTWQGLPDQPTASSSSIHSVDQDELWKEVEKGEQAGPSHQGGGSSIVRNSSLESSLHRRILGLDDSPYLLGKKPIDYWTGIRVELEHAASQKEYSRLLEFESRDLQIRELKQQCLGLYNTILKDNPTLADQAPYKPGEVLDDFFDHHSTRLDRENIPVEIKDRLEMQFLEGLHQRLREEDPNYVRTSIFFNWGRS